MNLDEIFKKIKKAQSDGHEVEIKMGGVKKNGEIVEIDMDQFEGRGLEDEQEVVKTIPVRKEWKKGFDELDSLAEDMKDIKAKLSSKKGVIWGQIDSDLSNYDNKHYNRDTQEIEILGFKKESKSRPIKSPIQGLM